MISITLESPDVRRESVIHCARRPTHLAVAPEQLPRWAGGGRHPGLSASPGSERGPSSSRCAGDLSRVTASRFPGRERWTLAHARHDRLCRCPARHRAGTAAAAGQACARAPRRPGVHRALSGRVASTAERIRGTACCIHRPHSPGKGALRVATTVVGGDDRCRHLIRRQQEPLRGARGVDDEQLDDTIAGLLGIAHRHQRSADIELLAPLRKETHRVTGPHLPDALVKGDAPSP